MFDVTNYNDSSNKKSSIFNAFLSKVINTYINENDFIEYKKGEEGNISDSLMLYNQNDKLSNTDTRYYGTIDFKQDDSFSNDKLYHAFPFDKNNFTLPLIGETIIILQIESDFFYLPYSNTLYPNYRQDYKTTEKFSKYKIQEDTTSDKNEKYKRTQQTGISTTKNSNNIDVTPSYQINEKIKFLKPKEGDTFLTGRTGNTIRFSEFHLTDDGKTSSPSIFIRNKQNPELDSKPIGTLIDEDINKDGTSIYITSNKVKVPFKETTKKQKVAFKDFPSSDKLKGDQLFVNSDRIVLSAKASEFIIFGKGNTGVITDGNYSIDAEKEVYIHNKKNITIHSEGSNQIFLNSDNGKVYIGKNRGEGDVGAPVQKMVLGGELISILQDLIIALLSQQYLTPSGPSKVGPENFNDFISISNKLNNILSSTNFLSK